MTTIPFPGKAATLTYTTAVHKLSEPKSWERIKVVVMKDGEPIYEYGRNYGMHHTFHPFHWWDKEEQRWHDYALISPKYTTFQVLDLESLEVVAERPYPQRDWYRTDKYDQYEDYKQKYPTSFEKGGWLEGKGPDDKINGEGFCPIDFYVPNPWLASKDGKADDTKYTDEHTPEKEWEQYADEEWHLDEVRHTLGHYGFVAGCIWGDDSSWKIRHIDLSRIKEGIVTEDERYGYVEMPRGSDRLKEAINVDDGTLTMTPTIYFSLTTGKASQHSRDGINWAENDQDYYGKIDSTKEWWK